MLSKVLKITTTVLFCISLALAIAAYISIKANNEAGGWLLLATVVIGVASVICAIVVIILGKGSFVEKLSKLFVLSSPFLAIFILVLFLIIMWTPVVILCIYSMIIWL